MLTALLTFTGLWIAFWNKSTSIDQQVLFEQARYLSRSDWSAFLEAFAHRPYVEYQPPFFTFWVSRIPVLWFHQMLLFPFGLLCVGLMRKLYGRQAALLCATPVFALMIHQPSTDTILFGMVLIVLRLHQLSGRNIPLLGGVRGGFIPPLRGAQGGVLPHQTTVSLGGVRGGFIPPLRGAQGGVLPHQTTVSLGGIRSGYSPLEGGKGGVYRFLAGFFYGLTWMIKPLTLLTVPYILPLLGVAGVGSLVMWGGYIWWSQRWEFGRHQFRFLLHQLFIKRMTSSGRKWVRPASRRSWLIHLWYAFLWRWNHLGRKAVMALPFYLFPAWLRAWTWKGIVLAAVIILGYGNSKYLLLNLLFLFPVNEEAESPKVMRRSYGTLSSESIRVICPRKRKPIC